VPVAYVALGDRLRVRLREVDGSGQRLRHLGLEVAAYEPVVRPELVVAVALRFELTLRHDDAKDLGGCALQLSEEVGVEAQLDQGRAPGRLRELGLDGLVLPRAEPALAINAKKYVSPPGPHAVFKPSLDDRVRAVAHRRERFVERPRRTADLDNALAQSRK